MNTAAALALAIGLMFGEPECKPQYSLGMPEGWWLLDTTGIDNDIPVISNTEEAA
jgi:hypothetical protein